ncbi:unnamed protein product [Paramecium sonneborni]|uniref:WD40-repeat-containing domain n=1 Tax=Paramecium sonneborni TaxID=65129 RepID=A0A8S1NBS4_9CILI|nr:unnamed protein product [Paramecium sonneborni]
MQMRCTQADHRNQQIIGFCIESTCPNQRPYCHFCLPFHGYHLSKLTSYELLSEWMKERILIIQDIQTNIQECKIALDNVINLFLPYNNFNLSQFPELGLSQVDQIIKDLCQMQNREEKLFKQLKQSIEDQKSIVNEILKKKKYQSNIKQNDNTQIPYCNIDQQIQEQPKNQKQKLNPFTLELIIQNSIRQNEWCGAIAFNKDYSIVVAGSKKDIKVFQQIQGKLNQIQQLSWHKKLVSSLNFMKNTNNFVSGSDDNSIIIWQVIGNNQWKIQQILNGHSDVINCLVLSNNDDCIFSGSIDKTIKCWMKQDQWFCQQTINDHTDEVYSLSLNNQQNKLISCSKDSQIFIIEQQKFDKRWSITQKIKADKYGLRLCFINDDQFTFQPYVQEQMDVYQVDSNTKQYTKTREIAVKCGSSNDWCLFPQQYLKSKCLLVNKNGNNVNLMRKKENGDFIVYQSIEFRSYGIYGQFSDNGEYLITWDNISKEIQIRKFRENQS